MQQRQPASFARPRGDGVVGRTTPLGLAVQFVVANDGSGRGGSGAKDLGNGESRCESNVLRRMPSRLDPITPDDDRIGVIVEMHQGNRSSAG